MPNKTLSVEQVLAILTETPKRLAALTGEFAPAQLRLTPAPGEWSATEVLAHLRSCADVWGDCIATILAEDAPTIRAIHPSAWINQTDYPDLDFGPSLRAFTAQRGGLLKLLEPLQDTDWSRTATITGAGKPLVRTVLDYGRWMAGHERAHPQADTAHGQGTSED